MILLLVGANLCVVRLPLHRAVLLEMILSLGACIAFNSKHPAGLFNRDLLRHCPAIPACHGPVILHYVDKLNHLMRITAFDVVSISYLASSNENIHAYA